jgi:methionyl aminopeptidase
MIRLKNKTQIDGIRRSCKLLAEVIQEIKAGVAPGVTTAYLDDIARSSIKARKGKPAFLGYQGYPAALCISVNEQVIHGIPGPLELKTGDIVSLDIGMIYDGYFSDCAMTLPVGKVTPLAERLMATTESCLYDAIEKAVDGNRLHDISRAVQERAEKEGFGIVHQFCGHGVGLALHEDPQIPNLVGGGSNPRLKPGMILAIEPMINAGGGDVDILDDDWTVVTSDGSLSAHFEHTIAILENGTEILTKL